jgi:hypothetical protein
MWLIFYSSYRNTEKKIRFRISFSITTGKATGHGCIGNQEKKTCWKLNEKSDIISMMAYPTNLNPPHITMFYALLFNPEAYADGDENDDK